MNLDEREQSLCSRRIGRLWEQVEADMAARQDEDQDRIKSLEDSLKKVCIDLEK